MYNTYKWLIILNGDYMLVIDYSVIKDNMINLKGKNKLILSLKNDAYGFKIDKIVGIADKLGINEFMVLNILDAIKIRKISNEYKIIMAGPILLTRDEYLNYNILPTVTTIEEYIFCRTNKIPFYIKIKSSMNRFGLELRKNMLKDNLAIGCYIYAAKRDQNIINNIEYYDSIIKPYNKDFHFGGGILSGINGKLRVGALLYKGCRSFYAYILKVGYLKKGDSLGYNLAYIADRNHFYAILDVGYYNGIKKDFKGYVYREGKRYNVIGVVCMNNTFIYADSDFYPGEMVEFFGSNINEDIFLAYNDNSLYESFFSIK